MRPLITLAVLAAFQAGGEQPTTLYGEKVKVWVTFETSERRGEAVYKTYCHHCHGARGDGSGHIGRGLLVKPFDFTSQDAATRMTPQAIAQVVRNGRPGTAMISWSAVLPDELIRDVARYTADLASEGRKSRPAETSPTRDGGKVR